MRTDIYSTWVQLIAITMGFLVSEVALGAGSCTLFPRGSSNPIVAACEEPHEYQFRFGDQSYSFIKDEFQARIRSAADLWFKHHDLSSMVEQVTKVEVWLSVPEANPLAAQGRAVFHGPEGNVSFSFDVKSNEWVFHDTVAAILGKNTYPQSFGHRPSTILVKSNPNASPSVVISSLIDSGATSATHIGGTNYHALSQAFQEDSLIRSIHANQLDVISAAYMNSVFEWIADRQMVFQFNLN